MSESKPAADVIPTPGPPPVRPGWQTTEFWLSLATTTVTVAIALGLVAADDRGHIETAVVHGIEAIGALFAAAWVVVTYARERTEAKIPR